MYFRSFAVEFANMAHIGLVAIGAFIILAGCFRKPAAQTETPEGIVKGQVIVGPARPVLRKNEPPPAMSKWYQIRKVMIYRKGQKTPVAEAALDANGYFKLSLEAGLYVVKMNLAGIERSADLPQEIVVRPGKTVEIRIDVDTGMR
ncbi:MAG: hypothetical protein ACE5HO_15115 [bacterium]